MHRRAAAPVREQSNNYVIERGLLICDASQLTDPRDSHEVCQQSWGARTNRDQGPKMPHLTRCESLDSANATEAA